MPANSFHHLALNVGENFQFWRQTIFVSLRISFGTREFLPCSQLQPDRGKLFNSWDCKLLKKSFGGFNPEYGFRFGASTRIEVTVAHPAFPYSSELPSITINLRVANLTCPENLCLEFKEKKNLICIFKSYWMWLLRDKIGSSLGIAFQSSPQFPAQSDPS